MNKWNIVKLSDIGVIVGGATPSTSKEEYYNGNIPWITPKDLSNYNNRYISRGERCITKTGLDSCSARILPKNTVLFSSRAPIGYIAIAKNELCTNQGFKSIIPNEKVNYLFLYYLLKYNKNKIELLGSGTTFKEVSGSTMKNISVYIPSLNIQNKIVSILNSIDSKIENNDAINNNIEHQSYEFYQELFVRNINSNWKSGTITDIGMVIGGGTPSKSKPEYYADKGIAWITPKDLSINKSKFIYKGENDITELGLNNSSATIMPEGTVLFSSRAPIGYIAIAAGEVTTNQGFKSVIPHPEIGTAFVYYFLKNNLSIIEGMASGSTFKEVSGSTMKRVPAIIPDKSTLTRFNEFCHPLFEKQKLLEKENVTLASIRDALLPRLMSGELDVSELDI